MMLGSWQLQLVAKLVLVLVLGLCATASQSTDESPDNDELAREYNSHSFSRPFTLFKGSTGQRQLSDSWKYGGNAIVKENFVRLTADQPSQVGYIFDVRDLKYQEFTALIRFRISGQGKSLFGDGLGFWVTALPNDVGYSKGYTPGNIFGHADKFIGFGILFDTYRNVEKGHVHKDISLVQSNGNLAVDLNSNRPGCAGFFRYYEGKDSFSVEDTTIAKITLRNNIVRVLFDRYADGHWIDCFKADLSRGSNNNKEKVESLPHGWQKNKKVRFEFSASTGSMSDNHDLLEFIVSPPDQFDTIGISSSTLKQSSENGKTSLLDFDFSDQSLGIHGFEHVEESVNELSKQVVYLSNELQALKKKASSLDHTMEHKMEAVETNLRVMIEKVGKDESAAEIRIADLEKRSTEKLNSELDRRLREVENKIQGGIESRLLKLESRVDKKVESSRIEAGSWKWPLLLLAIIVIGFFAWNFFTVRKLQSRDKLF